MDKIIPFDKGIRRHPASSEDGQSELVNLVPVNGELMNVTGFKQFHMGEESLILTNDEIIVSRHYVREGYHIITKDSENLYFHSIGGDKMVKSRIMRIISYKGVSVFGNTLVIYDDNKTVYAIWKNGKYSVIDLSDAKFSISIKSIDSTPVVQLNGYDTTIFPRNPETSGLSRSHIKEIYNYADSAINHVINAQSIPEEWHKYVTFGIAALRLYDGSYISYTVGPAFESRRNHQTGGASAPLVFFRLRQHSQKRKAPEGAFSYFLLNAFLDDVANEVVELLNGGDEHAFIG